MMETILCPNCGTENPAGDINCTHCGANLGVDLAQPDPAESAEGESAPQTASPGGSGKPANTAAVVVLSILAFFIGLFGIVILIGIGEGTNNAIYAFLAVSLPFALLSGFFAWLVPEAQWAVALTMPAPVAILCLMGASMGGIYLLGGIWTVFCAIAGARVGARLRRS